ncbi:agamous-like MADS-box protein AGL61 [Salvia splendens]|uniref:agamous-like MADS-box protein AGL61 n=1 Tax=Salvia splendens TaxID=180675 RepID=UPI001C266024|nr:agamous-like MADS-box protein AGL61 [Salvia splendens]
MKIMIPVSINKLFEASIQTEQVGGFSNLFILQKKKKNLSNRLVALSKRRLGLFKRASELCVLCGTEIAIIVQSLGKHFYSFGHNSTDAVIDRHLGGGEDHERDVVAAPAEFNLYRFVLKELELEKKRMKVAEEDDGGDVFWWNQGVEELELDELEQFAMALDELSKNADRRAKDLMGSFLSLSLAPPYRIALLLIKGWTWSVSKRRLLLRGINSSSCFFVSLSSSCKYYCVEWNSTFFFRLK